MSLSHPAAGRDVEIIAGTPPGGGQDRAARALAAALGGVLDTRVVVSNVPGRGGGNAWDLLSSHRGDPQRLSISSPTLITNRLTGVADLGPDGVSQLAILCTEYIAFGVPVESAVAGAPSLVARLRSPHPTSFALATALGNVNHMAVAYLCRHAGVDPKEVDVRVFDSARHAVADVLGGASDVVAVSAASVLPELDGGLLRLLAVSAPVRLGGPLGVVPTWHELGVDCTIGTWRGVVGEPGLGSDSIAAWEQTLSTAVSRFEWRDALDQHLWADTFLRAAATATFMHEQEHLMREALTGLGLLDG